MKKKLSLLFLIGAVLTGCYKSGPPTITDLDTDTDGTDPLPDADIDGDDAPDVRPDYPDMDIPDDVDCDQVICIDCECQCPDGSWQPWGGCYSVCEPIPECPNECPPGYCTSCTQPPECPDGPPDGPMGDPCMRNGDCESAGECYSENVQFYEGEAYTYWLGGYCTLSGAGSEGCDPSVPSSCPEGSVCIYLGEYMGYEWHGCFDACTPADSTNTPYDWACGCREGYECDLTTGACFPGCSHDRECCEFWTDDNYNGNREPGEVIFYPECEAACDNELGPDCKASYTCIYPGNDEAVIGDRCEHDYQCTPKGACLSSLYTDPATGDPYYPGGYCSVMNCQYNGRECLPYGGVCANMGGEDYTTFMCVRPCDVGTSPETHGYKCRSTPVEEAQACMPAWSSAFIEDPPGGEDGYCWFGNFPGGSKILGETCRDDEECDSPFGLGMCVEWFGSMHFCSTSCNEKLVNEHLICGEAGGDGIATGICAWNMCWEGCSDLSSPPGENGCSNSEMACAPLYIIGSSTYVPEGSTRPQGLCMPPCSTDTWCQTYFGPSRRCDTDTGSCL